VLYQSLGLDENSLLSSIHSFTDPQYDQEEEILAYEYNGSGYASSLNAPAFAFKLGFASRQVMTIAPQHVPVDVLPIDGINPLTSPQSVYDGTYPMSREIHILVRQNSSADVMQLVQYLESSVGQQALAEAGFLPLLQQ
jgi:ABC-type phosphate transport system substrate-binding protein